MASETTAKKTAPKTKKADDSAEKKIDPAPAAEEKQPFKLANFDPEQYVTVRNGFQGMLVYVSKRSGETFVWDNFGDEQEISLRELKNAKNASKGFFANNWFMFDDDWVVDYLGVRQFYKNSVSVDAIDSMFDKSIEELEKILDNIPNGQKRTIAYRARTLIENGKIDSLKTITLLEKKLGIQLIEK